jgi:hypothetical protein
MMGIEPTTLGLLDPRSNQLSYIGLLFLEKVPFIIIIKSKLKLTENGLISNRHNFLYED